MGLVSLLASLLGAGPAAQAVVAEPPHQQLAFVLLEKATLPDADAVLAAWRAVAPKGEAALRRSKEAKADDLLLDVGTKGFLAAVLLPVPVPGGEAEANFGASLSSRAEGAALRPHAAHLAVVFRDEPGRRRVEQLTRFTRLLAALVRASKAVGVYWGAAGATHTADFFQQMASEEGPGMLLLWTGVDVAQEAPGRLSLLTLGVEEQLGILDLRVTAPAGRGTATLATLFDLVSYAVKRGAAVPNGDTVGQTAQERLKVRHEPSPVDPKRTVWRVDLE